MTTLANIPNDHAATSAGIDHTDPGAVVTAFFDAYRAHDALAMADLCTYNADVHYEAFEAWGKQRVIRGDGKVHGVGRALWTGLIHAFPDLTNEVTSMSVNRQTGQVVAEVTVKGTQASAWGMFAPRGGTFCVPHLFSFHVDPSGLIDSVTAYWDNATLSRQLGHLEVD